MFGVVVCTCAVRNCLECRYRQQCSVTVPSLPPAVGDQLSPIQALIAGVQAPPRPSEPVGEYSTVTSLCMWRDFVVESECNENLAFTV